ncbi:hypothetical protein ILYODFUR_017677 [Ilyodon furcidens]|uniref:Uncharacterized protein n=1 Tax=Ilyodon furcidens TaxID=33524 RepID=A0ABV0UL32_9TELE
MKLSETTGGEAELHGAVAADTRDDSRYEDTTCYLQEVMTSGIKFSCRIGPPDGLICLMFIFLMESSFAIISSQPVYTKCIPPAG